MTYKSPTVLTIAPGLCRYSIPTLPSWQGGQEPGRQTAPVWAVPRGSGTRETEDPGQKSSQASWKVPGATREAEYELVPIGSPASGTWDVGPGGETGGRGSESRAANLQHAALSASNLTHRSSRRGWWGQGWAWTCISKGASRRSCLAKAFLGPADGQGWHRKDQRGARVSGPHGLGKVVPTSRGASERSKLAASSWSSLGPPRYTHSGHSKRGLGRNQAWRSGPGSARGAAAGGDPGNCCGAAASETRLGCGATLVFPVFMRLVFSGLAPHLARCCGLVDVESLVPKSGWSAAWPCVP